MSLSIFLCFIAPYILTVQKLMSLNLDDLMFQSFIMFYFNVNKVHVICANTIYHAITGLFVFHSYFMSSRVLDGTYHFYNII